MLKIMKALTLLKISRMLNLIKIMKINIFSLQFLLLLKNTDLPIPLKQHKISC